MKTTISLRDPSRARDKRLSQTRIALSARLVLGRLERIESGNLTLAAGAARHEFGRPAADLPPAAIHVRDPRFWRAVLLRGSVGAGEAYARGWWTSDDPTAVVRLFVRNRAALQGVERGMARVSRPFLAAFHALRRNTQRGSRANVEAHYDLSNDFFALFLDDTLTYSCGIFEHAAATLREASIAKIDRLCRKLELSRGDHLLEIGTGWGALALHAAGEYGCRVTTTTVSTEQLALARERVQASGLQGRIELLDQDYRALTGTYDKLVSVEMIEAVGHHYFDDFFRQCAARLAPGGLMALQAITVTDHHYDEARNTVDFIKRHIFPGSCIPSVTALCASMARASDLRLVHLEDIGPHYVRTLALWRENLRTRWSDARRLGLSEEFLRLWEFYFCYCEGGFAEGFISDVQMLFNRPSASRTPILPQLG